MVYRAMSRFDEARRTEYPFLLVSGFRQRTASSKNHLLIMLFKDIVGQEELKKQLIETARKGTVAHAQLFCA